MCGDVGAVLCGLFDGGTELVNRERRLTHVGGRCETATARGELDEVCAVLEQHACRLAHLVGAVSLDARVEGVAAGDAHDATGHLHARCLDLASTLCVAHGHRGDAGRTGYADGRDAGVQQFAHGRQTAQHRAGGVVDETTASFDRVDVWPGVGGWSSGGVYGA